MALQNALGGLALDKRFQSSLDYRASVEAGQKSFIITTGYLTVSTGADSPFAYLVNEGTDYIYFTHGEFMCSADAMFKHLEGGTDDSAKVPAATGIPAYNTSGGAATSGLKFYGPADFTHTLGTGDIHKVVQLRSYETYHTELRGFKLAPGGSITWTIDTTGGAGGTAAINLEYYELSESI